MSSFESSTAELGNERTPRFERLLTSISHHFLRLDATNLEVGIIGALRGALHELRRTVVRLRSAS